MTPRLSPEHPASPLVGRAVAAFSSRFGREPEAVAVAPGRVNLIGEHTDYNDGFVMPMAIDRFVACAFASRPDAVLEGWAETFGDVCRIALDTLSPARRSATWFDYAAGVCWALRERGAGQAGLSVAIVSDLPAGAGLSSSAAVEMAVLRAATHVARSAWEPLDAPRIALRAEHDYVGLSCGIMDQFIVANGRAGHAMLLDCRSLASEHVPVPSEVRVVVMDTGVRRRLAGSEYDERAASCRRATEIARRHGYAVTALRDVDADLFAALLPFFDETTARRARHVVDEILRPVRMSSALGSGDVALAGALMKASHESLRDLYDVSCLELDIVVDAARAHPACFGARMTGAGFGGCAIALVEAARCQVFVAEVSAAIAARGLASAALFPCRPMDGVCLVSPSAGA
ncbi:MAG: galactokinase [Vicinamibacterales bacterium]